MRTGLPLACLLPVVFAACGGSGSTATRVVPPESAVGGPVYNVRGVNTDADEFAPCLTTGEGFAMTETGSLRMFFTSNRQGDAGPMLDRESRFGEAVWTATGRADEFSKPVRYSPQVLAKANTGTATVFRGVMYFARSYEPDGRAGSDIFSWTPGSTPVPIDSINSPWWDAQPAVSPDGGLLVFASDRIPRGPAPSDSGRRAPHLWCSRMRPDGRWGRPELLPEPINSNAAEMSPHFGADGYFYFSSTRPGGSGGYDIWRARFVPPAMFETPQVLAAPVNSPSDDLFPWLLDDKVTMYFASDRPGGRGGFDIWGAQLTYRVPLSVTVVLLDERGRETAAGAVPVTIVRRDPNGPGETLTLGTDSAGRVSSTLRSGASYTVSAGTPDCFDMLTPGSRDVTAPLPFDQPEGVSLVFRLRRKSFPDAPMVTDSVPYFVTGYWYPNTLENWRRLRARIDAGEMKDVGFVDVKDESQGGADAYPRFAEHITRQFDALYDGIERMILPMYRTCFPSTTSLTFVVRGYVDPRPLAWGVLPEAERRIIDTVPRLLQAIGRTYALSGESGNIEKLTLLRAYFTMRMIDDAMSARSEAYRALKAEGRIAWDYGVGGIAEGQGANDYRYRRKIDVRVR